MSTSVGMTRTEKVTGKSAARHKVIKLVFGPQHAKGCRPLFYILEPPLFYILEPRFPASQENKYRDK